ncbi:2Fe-2S iron-sulfur cluster-binding protein [Alsobacter sp. SYSU M60028]|uniref:2Fe-2S iron-sulfur cluster-binding protein n=1 Tax=Alsobacter ponti TaxID=2962936 RepID=A0ABT1LAH3_9HYPH|nr:2Fe-2S iron-sulfur cluster-binding protein [Alsobacter ponti]MCP8937248.1 2Fe-2S iron-sulfur cluster-binding protein [Alsobacter ponti]
MHIFVTDHHGAEHELEALEGWRVMEVIRDWGVGIKAECGGACACATCHVYVDPAWIDRLPAPTDEELDRLDEAHSVTELSRLSCQILTTEELDGLRVRLAPGSEPEDVVTRVQAA